MDLSRTESAAVASLKRLAKRWPNTLQLFSWSGTLYVFKPTPGLTLEQATVTTVCGIPNDGGDPNGDDKLWPAPPEAVPPGEPCPTCNDAKMVLGCGFPKPCPACRGTGRATRAEP
jgi:hypothetical protein